MPARKSNTRTIAQNSFWYGLETVISIVALLGISIPMARALGPEKIGYFNYVMWLANTAGAVGSIGIPITTRKYIAEYLGRNEPGIARGIFFQTFRLQTILAVAITAASLAVLFFFGDPQHHAVSAIQILAVLPAMAGFIPAGTNTARENNKANVLPSVIGNVINVAAVGLSLRLGWGLMGIASGFLIGRTVEFLVRLLAVLSWARECPAEPIPPELRRKMRSFSQQSIVLLILNLVVWGRSDIVLLKWLSSNIAHVTFFSIAFNLTEKVMLVPQVFGQALGATVMVQYGRDKSQLARMVSDSARYMLLCTVPLLVGMAALSGPIIRILYGVQYLPAIPVLATAALFAIPKPLLLPAQHYLQANERQGFLIWCNLVCGAVNIIVDWLLIPHFGAMGAAIGNGSAQALAMVGIWVMVIYAFQLSLDGIAIVKILSTALIMGAVVYAATLILPPILAMPVGVLVGAMIFILLIRQMRCLRDYDRVRLNGLASSAPKRLRPMILNGLAFLQPEVAIQAAQSSKN